MATVIFTSKDPNIAEYYEKRFGKEFTKAAAEAEEAARNMPGWGTVRIGNATHDWRAVLVQMFNARMLREAERQEHYNYDLDENGHRRVIYVESENAYVPQLLIPKIEIG